MKKNISLICLFALLLLNACKDDTKTQETEVKDSTGTSRITKEDKKSSKGFFKKDTYNLSKEEKSILLLSDSLPLGTHSGKVKGIFSEARGPFAKSGNTELTHDITEVVAPVKLFDREVQVEFNFNNDSLYCFYYSLEEKDSLKAEKITKTLSQLYSSKFGSSSSEENNGSNSETNWKVGNSNFILTKTQSIILWGMENK